MSLTDNVEYERTLAQLPQVYVFKIPPRNAEGHRASNWPTQSTWSGKVKIVAKGALAVVQLWSDANQLFATCPVRDDTYVERTIDSGRYFALKIENNQGKHAFIGIAFNDRNHAFDFNVALDEHKNQTLREEQAKKAFAEMQASHAGENLHLGAGEKIKINIAKKTGSSTTSNSAAKPLTSSSGGMLLAPPGGSSSSSKSGLLSPPSASTQSQAATNNVDVFSSFSSSSSSSQENSSNAFSDPFASSNSASSFGSSSNNAFGSSSDPFASFSDPFASSSTSTSSSSSDPFGFSSNPASTSTSDPFASNSNNSWSSSSFTAPPTSNANKPGNSGSLLDF